MGTTKLTVDDGGGGMYEFDGFGSNGLMAGGFLGYNHQINSRFVVGVEGHASGTTINNRIALEGEGSIETGTDRIALVINGLMHFGPCSDRSMKGFTFVAQVSNIQCRVCERLCHHHLFLQNNHSSINPCL